MQGQRELQAKNDELTSLRSHLQQELRETSSLNQQLTKAKQEGEQLRQQFTEQMKELQLKVIISYHVPYFQQHFYSVIHACRKDPQVYLCT